MPDLEKVLKGLECCMDILHAGPGWSQGCIHCPYSTVVDVGRYPCMRLLANDAMELLKEQEAVEPVLVYEGANKQHNNYKCPKCHTHLYYEQRYCEWCGRKVKWDETEKDNG